MRPSVLVVCGDDTLRAALCAQLVQAKMGVQAAADAGEFEVSEEEWPFDIVVCDIDLPDGGGCELVTRLRSAVRCGVIALSSSPQREGRMLAMRLGADHHLSAPVDHEEFEVMIRNLHRRVGSRNALARESNAAIKASGASAAWRLDATHWTLVCPAGGQGTQLSFPEYQVLHRLTASPGQVVTRDELLQLLSHGGIRVYGRNLDMMMSRLRRKIHKCCGETLPIHSARGIGYVFNGRAERLE